MFLDRLRRERVAVPVAMAFIAFGLTLIAASLALPHSATLNARYSPDTVDFLRGLLIGIAVALEIVGLSALVPALAAKRQKPSPGSR